MPRGKRPSLVLAALLTLGACQPDGAGPMPAASEDDAPVPSEIAWVPYDQAFALAQQENKPVVVVMTATWCGHCRTYQGVLSDPEVIRESQNFVMVRVDVDEQPAVSARHAYDGGYVPRTLFFTPEGTHRTDLHAARPSYRYFVDTQDRGELLGLMRRAENRG